MMGALVVVYVWCSRGQERAFCCFCCRPWSESALILRRMCGFVVPCVHVVWHRHFNQGSEPELSGHVSVVRPCGAGVSE